LKSSLDSKDVTVLIASYANYHHYILYIVPKIIVHIILNYI